MQAEHNEALMSPRSAHTDTSDPSALLSWTRARAIEASLRGRGLARQVPGLPGRPHLIQGHALNALAHPELELHREQLCNSLQIKVADF